MENPLQCPFCKKIFRRAGDLAQHSTKSACRRRFQLQISEALRIAQQDEVTQQNPGTNDQPQVELETMGESAATYFDFGDRTLEQINPDVDSEFDIIKTEQYPNAAGTDLGLGDTPFELRRECEEANGEGVYGLFETRAKWDFAKWAMTSGLSNASRDELLGLPPEVVDTPWRNNRELLKAVDSLPHGPDWNQQTIRVIGDTDSDGRQKVELLELWTRDPLECLKQLISNPLIARHMKYAPVRKWRIRKGQKRRVYDEMWTGNWWWKTQNQLTRGATIAPLILASDKTQLSVFSGDKQAWPVYLTIGNIAKAVRRKPSTGATVLIGYLPVSKLEIISNQLDCRKARWNLFHTCMERLLKPFEKAGKVGVVMVCADSRLRRIFPILASYISDFPEQSLISCCMESRCPICCVIYMRRGDLDEVEYREQAVTWKFIERNINRPSRLEEEGLRAIVPFWRSLPFLNIHRCFLPDTLHQIHKGVFNDHLVKWCTGMASAESTSGKELVDHRIASLPRQHGLRHFKRGVSHFNQWTGREAKELEKIFLAVVANVIDAQAVKAARALLDFIYLTHLPSIDEHQLERMKDALGEFHTVKSIFLESGTCTAFHTIPKLHSLTHYSTSIPDFGSADGSSTEAPERLHIDYAKLGYRASNRNNYLKQMAMWLQRQEAVRSNAAYIWWRQYGTVTDEDLQICDEESEQDHQDEHVNTDSDYTDALPVRLHEQTHNYYPSPIPSVTNKPLYSNRLGVDIIRYHHAPNFIESINKFISDYLPQSRLRLTDQDRFDVWIKIRLSHSPNAVLDYPHLETIRCFPERCDSSGKIKSPEFDHVLLLHDNNQEGLYRYRMARLKVIFRMPRLIRSKIPHLLAHVDLFNSFSSAPRRGVSKFYTASTAQTPDRKRRSAVIFLKDIKMACHPCPIIPRGAEPNWNSDTVGDQCPSFYFNEFFSHHIYSYMDCWRELSH